MIRTLFFIAILSSGKLASQTMGSPISEVQPLSLNEELPEEGTYQILLKNGTSDSIVPQNILLKVNLVRHHDNEIFWPVSNTTRLRILPFVVIRENNFIPLPKYAYEN